MAEPTSKDYDWAALVRAHEGPALLEKSIEYQFANGRKFEAPLIPYQSEIPEGPAP